MGKAEQISQFAVGLKYSDLGPSTIHETKRRILDSFATSLGAYQSKPATIVRNVTSFGTCDKGGATIIGSLARVTPDMAAFANSTMIRYLDYNDTYLSLEPAHPSDNIGATLAAAESKDADGKALILGTVIAYEIQCRLCDAASLRAQGWDHVTYGPFSAAAGVGKIFSLTEEQMVNALGLAGVCNNAMRQTRVGEISMWKACAFANSSRGALLAVELAAEGFTGPPEIFEGKMAFINQVSGPMKDLEFSPGGGKPFMLDWTYIKYYNAEYHAQSAIGAALAVRKDVGPENIPGSVEEIIIDTHSAAYQIIGSEPAKWKPQAKETADHSLPYITACALMDGKITTSSFKPERFTDPVLLDLTAKVKCVEDADYTARYPDGFGNRVTVKLKGGTTKVAEELYPKGHPRNAMTDGEIEEKFHTLAEPVMGEVDRKALVDLCWKLDELDNISELVAATRCNV
jgi:2-methylcitrate dehydratase